VEQVKGGFDMTPREWREENGYRNVESCPYCVHCSEVRVDLHFEMRCRKKREALGDDDSRSRVSCNGVCDMYERHAAYDGMFR